MTGVWRGFCFVPTPPRTVFRTFSFHSSYCLHTHVPLDYILHRGISFPTPFSRPERENNPRRWLYITPSLVPRPKKTP